MTLSVVRLVSPLFMDEFSLRIGSSLSVVLVMTGYDAQPMDNEQNTMSVK